MLVQEDNRQPIKILERNSLHKAFPTGRSVYFFFKRITDLLLSLCAIICILSWLLPILAILIKVDSKGPVFFLQKRTGKGGHIFTCYKLRTMVLNPYADTRPAIPDDPRTTRIGKFLRRSNLDELPQFLNILLGSMSLIGPRPHMIYDCNRFASQIPGYAFRNLVRPGLTGLAQVKGFHGPVLNKSSCYIRYEWDAFYVRNANYLLDLRILRETIKL